MATRRPAASSRSTAGRSTRPAAYRRRRQKVHIAPDLVRQVLGVGFLILGVTLLIGLTLKGGQLTDLELNLIAPWFGSMRWFLPLLLIPLGYYLERANGEHWDWQLTVLGVSVGYVAAVGFGSLVNEKWGGTVGRAVAGFLSPLVTAPGAGLILAILVIAGALLALDMSLPAVVEPPARLLGRAFAKLFRPAPKPSQPGGASLPARSDRTERTAGDWSAADLRSKPASDRTGSIPVPIQNAGPTSQTFAPPAAPSAAPRDGGPLREAPSEVEGGLPGSPGRDGHSIRDGAPARGQRSGLGEGGSADGGIGGAPATTLALHREYHLPPLALLEDITPRAVDSPMDHARNAAIIEGKLASFQIPARVAVWNAGPVVTQYEVEPSPDIKVSRIEALADDLAMALAARTIRIEAPIPGKSVVGIEIPNKDFNIVALRRILEEVDLRDASKLTFALGRDVAGHARAADLAKMPHLLIAGATGSGKSVMVNALITSLLCNATPDEVRLVLIDLKSVELSAYNGLPHLMVPVITEPGRAKAALKWAVNEMENRFRRFAGASARNVAGFNETRADPADRMPYLVIVIDELADLMMRGGKDMEEPIVRLAQKARATGIHLVLATQRPSVNVVTGLIKANFPSRIAFAMSSQIDSRTIIDTPGAEDLIGRGDMLFQPADLPRPIRLQGVFVSDKEIANIGEHWRAEAEPHYDMGIVETDEEPEGLEQPIDSEADRLLLDAMGVIQEYDRASASLLQRRLKIGYARAARIIDQLEARGYIGPFDGSNARQVLRGTGTPSNPAFGSGEDDE
ncbi:MAG: DNA translocase FtsK 4TM domain-containing protein [Candidatus Limnocylindrales bacterium]